MNNGEPLSGEWLTALERERAMLSEETKEQKQFDSFYSSIPELTVSECMNKSYQSPINIIMGQMNTSYENGILKAVQNVGILVDKNELLKALYHDREQYEKGYADRDSEIIRCKDCKWYDESNYMCDDCKLIHREPTFFCADGKRRTDDD